MEVTKLQKQNHYDEIAQQIKEMIMQGQLKMGDKLPSTKELSERFGVGRSTIREALSALKAMGLIEIRQGRGVPRHSASTYRGFPAGMDVSSHESNDALGAHGSETIS